MNSCLRLVTAANLCKNSRFYHSSKTLFYPGQEWRKKKGFAANPNAYGALTDLPDYSFIDGKPTPPCVGQVERAILQRELTEKIIRLGSEVDYAVERRAKLDQEEVEEKQRIINSKLKPKGKNPELKPPSS